MSETRMAGSEEFKEELSRSARNKQIREEIGNDPDQLSGRIAGVDRDAYDFEGYTDKQINMALQGESFGDKDYERLTGGMPETQNPVEEVVPDTPEVTDPVKPVPTEVNVDFGGDNGNPFIPEMRGPGSGDGQTVYQDNDQQSSVVGDNNTVNQDQDNSVTSYGGNSSWKDAWMKNYFS